MLPDHIRFKNINHIAYNVGNKDADLQGYQDVLGLGRNAFEVDEIEAAHAYLIRNGLVPTEFQTRNDGPKAFDINDPDGDRIELCTKSGFGVVV